MAHRILQPKTLVAALCLFFLSNMGFGQDTLWLEKKPKVILKSWYPEYIEFPALKIGERKILFTIIPNLETTLIRDHTIELTSSVSAVKIEETDKLNQFIVTVEETTEKQVFVSVWLDLKKTVVMLKNKGVWMNIEEVYSPEDGGVFLEEIRLKIIN